MLDAKELLDLIYKKWDLPELPLFVPYSLFLINGGFETGTFPPWKTNTSTITDLEKHSGNYSAHLNNSAIWQEIRSITKSYVKSFGLYFKGEGYIEVKLLFNDETYTSMEIPHSEPYNEWEYIDILNYKDPETGNSLFPNGKIVNYISIEEELGNSIYIDDVTLEVAGELYLQLDEFNPNMPKYQLVFINRPARTIFLSPNVFKIEQDIQIELHVKLIKYDPNTVSSLRDIFTSIKAEVKRILNIYRFNEVGSTLNISGWIDAKLPHGFGLEVEPLELVSRLTLQIIYYNIEDETLVGVRVHKVTILSNDLLGLIDATWIDTDPWVRIEIPKGPIIEQNLIGPHIHGEITTHDYASLYELLYNTEIPENPEHYPINSDNSKTKFSTTIPSSPEFIIEMKDNEGNSYIYNFYNVRIKQIELVKTPTSGLTEAVWRILWMADYLYYGVPV